MLVELDDAGLGRYVYAALLMAKAVVTDEKPRVGLKIAFLRISALDETIAATLAPAAALDQCLIDFPSRPAATGDEAWSDHRVQVFPLDSEELSEQLRWLRGSQLRMVLESGAFAVQGADKAMQSGIHSGISCAKQAMQMHPIFSTAFWRELHRLVDTEKIHVPSEYRNDPTYLAAYYAGRVMVERRLQDIEHQGGATTFDPMFFMTQIDYRTLKTFGAPICLLNPL